MAHILIVQGKHAGKYWTWRDLPPYWDVPVPPTIKIDFCPTLTSESPKFDVIRYKMVFVSIDRQWGIYAENGEPGAILTARDWIMQPSDYVRKPQPVYMEYQ